MNAKAQALGMADTRYVEPTGLSSRNQSSAATWPRWSMQRTGTRSFASCRPRPITWWQSASADAVPQYQPAGPQPDREIGLQKTGYISEAGRCL
jgi:D-alanyl-D-alanine endopeptidase (penicillin-binding protein 7)